MLFLSMLPAASALAASNFITNVTTSVNGSTVSATSTTHPQGLHVWYQFRATAPSGHTWIMRKFESGSSVQWTPPTTGTYQVQAFALTQWQVQHKDWKAAVTGTITNDVADQVASISIAGAPTSNIATNTAETLSVVATDSSKNVVANPGTPTWSLPSGTTGATIQNLTNGGVVFDATAAGSYTVTATLNGLTATSTIVVYGAPAAVKLSPASASLVADGSATDTVTATVVDANGNTVPTFNGQLTVTDTGAGTNLVDASGSAVAGNTETLTAKNGTVSFNVQANTVAGVTDTISATEVGATTITGKTTIATEAQVATSVQVVTPTADVAANAASTATVEAQVVDQDGQPMLYGTYPITFTVSGAATLQNANTAGSYTTTFVGNGSSTNANPATATVQSTTGQTGAITITASSAGLTAGSGTMQAVITGVPHSIQAKLAASSFAEGSTGVKLNLQTLDANGYAVSDSDAAVVVNVTQNGNEATNITIGGQALTSNSTGVTVDLGSNGSASPIIVDNGSGADAGNYAITVSPITNATYAFPQQTVPLVETAGAATVVSVKPAGDYVTTGAPTTQVTAQLQDAYGNSVSESGVPVTLTPSLSTATINGASSVTLDTNSMGQVTGSLTLPATAGSATFVTASTPNLASSSSSLVTVETQIAGSVQVSLKDATTGSLSEATAGDTVDGTIKVLDANGNQVSTSDAVQVTVSPAAALTDTNLTATSTPGVYTGQAVSGLLDFTAKAGQEGGFTVTATDTSVAQAPKGSAGMSILPGGVQSYGVFYNGTNVGSTANNGGLTVTSSTEGTAIPVFVKATDSQGNPVVSNGNTYVNLSSSDTATSWVFRATASGAHLANNQIDIPAGSTGVEVYYVDTTPGTYALTATAATQQVPDVNATSVTAVDVAPNSTGLTVTVQPENGNGQDLAIPTGDTINVTPLTGADVTSIGAVQATAGTTGTTPSYTATFTAGSSAGTAQFQAGLYNSSGVLVETFASEPTAYVSSLSGVTPTVAATEALHGIDLTGYTESSNGATTYEIYRSTGTTSVSTSGTPYTTTTATSYEDTNVVSGTTYNYEVVAEAANGATSSASSEASQEYGTALAATGATSQGQSDVLTVTFDESLLTGTATPADFSVSAPGSATLTAESAVISGKTVTLTFGSALPMNATLNVTAGAVLDTVGVANLAGTTSIPNGTAAPTTAFSAAVESGQTSTTSYASVLSDFATSAAGSVLFQIPTVTPAGMATFSSNTAINLATETPSISGGATAATAYAGVLVANPSGVTVLGVTMNGTPVAQADWGLDSNGNLPIYVAIGTSTGGTTPTWSAVTSIPTTTWTIAYSNGTVYTLTTGQS